MISVELSIAMSTRNINNLKFKFFSINLLKKFIRKNYYPLCPSALLFRSAKQTVKHLPISPDLSVTC